MQIPELSFKEIKNSVLHVKKAQADILYFADNLGFVYAINPDTGEIIWIENYKTEFNSSIKIKNNNIYVLRPRQRTT